jgi:hypothetical protein
MVLVANNLHSQLEPSSIVNDMDAPLSPRDLALLVVLGTAGRARAPLAGPAASALRHERMRMACELVWLDAMTLRQLPQEAAE